MNSNQVVVSTSPSSPASSSKKSGWALLPLNASLQLQIVDHISSNVIIEDEGPCQEIEYYSFREFKEGIEGMTSNERQAIIKFLGLPEKVTTDEIAQIKWKQFESFSQSEEKWSSVGSAKEYINHMLKFLTGSLMMTSGHGAPLDPESYLILPDLIK